MNPKIEHFLRDLDAWLDAVASVHSPFEPISTHVRRHIESDLLSLEQGRPFDGILRDYPIGVADTAHSSEESAGSDDSSERQ
jgi:hypothetical protein